MAVEVEEFPDTVIPVLVFFVVLNVLGVIGNSLIIFIYSFRYEKNHFRRLVLSLSCVDMISCCTTVPMETVSTWYWFDAPSRGLCKLKNFCVQFSALSAIYMLFITAIYKYLRICRPFGKQVTKKNILVLFFTGLGISLVLATPAAIIWDVNENEVVINNVTETIRVCEVYKEYKSTVYPVVYRNVLSIYDLFVLATIILYVFVAKKIIIHIRQKKKKKTYQPEKGSGVSASSTVDNTGDQPKNESGVSASGTVANTGATTSDTENELERTSNDRNATNRQSRRSRRFRLSSSQIRKAVIMVILAGTFCVTFLMGLSFGYVFAIRGFDDFSSAEEIVQLFVCYKFYYANYALNSIVYFILDRNFRREVFNIPSLVLSKLPCVRKEK